MKKIILLYNFLNFLLLLMEKNLKNCEWKNKSGKPCLTIFSPPNTSKITEKVLVKELLQKSK